MNILLDILKKSDVGITLPQLRKKCEEEGIKKPIPELKLLVDEGLARIDKKPEPVRVKATPKAFEN